MGAAPNIVKPCEDPQHETLSIFGKFDDLRGQGKAVANIATQGDSHEDTQIYTKNIKKLLWGSSCQGEYLRPSGLLPPPQGRMPKMKFDINEQRAIYLEYIYRRRAEREEARHSAPKPKTLSEQIAEWYESLDPASQRAAFNISFFVTRFNATPQQVSKVLFALNWSRFRRWETGKPHCRLWQKNAEHLS